jgi:hypothetical protein
MIRNFSKSVATAGTAVALQAGRTPAAWAVIQAFKGNTGSVYIGGSASSPTNGGAAANTIELAKGDSISLPAMGVTEPYDLSTVLVNADTGNDGVHVVYGRA